MPWARPIIAGRRLYIASTGDSDRLLCYEETEAADLKTAGEPVEPDGRLAFRIEDVHAGQRLTRRKPFFAAGGSWSVLECALEAKGAGTFFLAIREGRGAGEGSLWVVDAAASEALLKAVRAVFPVGGLRVGPTGTRAQGPKILDVDVLGADTDESGAGRGTWVHSKWTGQRASPEFYLNWSLAEMRGAITEKDGTYRKELVRLIAGLLVR